MTCFCSVLCSKKLKSGTPMRLMLAPTAAGGPTAAPAGAPGPTATAAPAGAAAAATAARSLAKHGTRFFRTRGKETFVFFLRPRGETVKGVTVGLLCFRFN